MELLRRLVDAAGIHVVLVLRDDFLLQCHGFRELEPIFSELTPVGPPDGAKLRRALTEPAAATATASRASCSSTRWWRRWRRSGGRCRCSRSQCRGCGSCGTASGGC